MMHQQTDATLATQEVETSPFFYGQLRLCRDFFELTKPRIMVLLLISTCCPMILASQGQVPFAALFWALLGGALCSGSASAINCIWDRDIDSVMERTKNRPLVRRSVSVRTALLFSLVIGVAGIAILAKFLNFYAAGIALFGHFFYVFIYTMWLKRSTPQNIVIGGAAGAVPPIVGWVAVTGVLDLSSVLMFFVIFLWTPPHFWALALNKNADYQRANIPMLPVVRGEAVTHRWMLMYALSLLPVSLLLAYFNPSLGWLSFTTFGSLGAIFVWKIWELQRFAMSEIEGKSKKAWDVFGFSLIYLALFFVCLVIDSTLV